MRSIIIFAIAAVAMLVSASAYAQKPYDPYRWCAVYGGRGGGATNCGFITLAQCRATVSGIGGFCEPNQFYNPEKSRRSKR
jgi:hypothetical protein